MAWERVAEQRGLKMYEMANEVHCYYFIKDLVENDEIEFKNVKGEMTSRQVVGYKTLVTGKRRIWHFGIQARPLLYPTYAYIIKPHVLFSDEGSTIWESKERLHRARRSQCRNWWNPEWRDRILATMTWLADEEGRIEVSLGSNVVLYVSSYPLTFSSPVSYGEPKTDSSATYEGEGEDDYKFDEEDEEEEVGEELDKTS